MVEIILQDLRYGARQLKQSPGFTLVAVLSLALGIGANAAMFQLVNAIRLTLLPVENPKELVSIYFDKDKGRAGWWSSRSANFTYAQWEQIRQRQQAFTGLIAWSATRFNLVNGGEPRFAEGLYVNGDFFRVLGVKAALGRTFTAQDDSPACSAGAVVSHAFWQRELAGDPAALGRPLSLSGHSVPVIGITPASFFGVEVGSRYDVAIPLCADPDDGRRPEGPDTNPACLVAFANGTAQTRLDGRARDRPSAHSFAAHHASDAAAQLQARSGETLSDEPIGRKRSGHRHFGFAPAV